MGFDGEGERGRYFPKAAVGVWLLVKLVVCEREDALLHAMKLMLYTVLWRCLLLLRVGVV